MRRFTLVNIAMICAMFVCSFGAYAGATNTPIEAFIAREKQQHEFVPVQGLWETSTRFPVAATEQYVSGAQVLDIDFAKLARLMQEKNQAITLVVNGAGGKTYEVELARFDAFSKDFKIEEKANGKATPYNYSRGLYYRGVVKGYPGSIAAFSFFNGEVFGVFSVEGGGNNVLVPNTLEGAGNGNYLLYNDADLKIQRQGELCGTDRLPKVADMKNRAQNKNVFNTCKDVEMMMSCDFETYLDFNQNTTTLANYLTSTFNLIATLYRNEGIYISIKYMEVNTQSDAYQWLSLQSHEFLYEYASTTTDLHDADLAMLLSTRGGSMGGVAFLGNGDLCSSAPFSFSNIVRDANNKQFPTYTWDVHMMTHEWGHNFGSPHTHNCDWNGNGTAIDACVPTNGGCPSPVPAKPVGGGTIMSYCHMGHSVSFTKGFGPQPGDLLRNTVDNSFGCLDIRLVTQPTAAGNTIVVANRECTDNGMTYYWNDGNNTDETDDVLALMIRKAGSNIGTLDETGFAVKSGTTSNYSSNTGATMNKPTGAALKGTNYAINRYWSVIPKTQPTGEVEVIFPFTKQDIADVDGSVSANVSVNDMIVYIAANSVSADPQQGLNGATANDVNLLYKGASATTTSWSASTNADTIYAHFNLKNFGNGGSLIYTYSQNETAVQDVYSKENAVFYPNPTTKDWNVWVPANTGDITFRLFTTDGRLVQEQTLVGGQVNEVKAMALPAGLYFYRINSAANVQTGSLQKN